MREVFWSRDEQQEGSLVLGAWVTESPAADWSKWLNPDYCKPSSRPPAEGSLNSPYFVAERKLFGCKPDFLSICLPLWGTLQFICPFISSQNLTTACAVITGYFYRQDLVTASDLPKKMRQMDGNTLGPPILAQWFFFPSYVNYGLYKWCIDVVYSHYKKKKTHNTDKAWLQFNATPFPRWVGVGTISWHT